MKVKITYLSTFLVGQRVSRERLPWVDPYKNAESLGDAVEVNRQASAGRLQNWIGQKG